MINFDNNDLGMISLLLFGAICLIGGTYALVVGVEIGDLLAFALAIAGMISALANNRDKRDTGE